MSLYSLEERFPQLPDEGRYWVADNAVIVGDVLIEEDVGIWFATVLRGDNERITVGKGSNIQEHCLLHTDMGYPMTIGAGCTIGHGAILHGCTIKDNSLIGMGATVLNGAVIGKNCLVGAGALVLENEVIPDNSLVVGMPARVVKQLDEEAIRALEKTSRGYVSNWQRFVKHMKPYLPS